jgi:hypothetical protein
MIVKRRLCLACTATQDVLEDQIKHVLQVLWLDYTLYRPYDPYDGRQDIVTVPLKGAARIRAYAPICWVTSASGCAKSGHYQTCFVSNA